MPLDLPTFDQLFAIGKDEITSRNSKLDPSEVDRRGSDVNIINAVGSAMAEEILRQLFTSYNDLFLDPAVDDGLDRLAFDRYGLGRQGASQSRGAVAFSRATAGEGAGTIPIGTRLISEDGIEFDTTTTASFGAVALGPITANVKSVKAGVDTNVVASQITQISSAIFDGTITVTNSAATTGGADQETDDEFKNRVRKFFPNARRGTLEAIELGALSVDGVRLAKAVERTDESGIPSRWVDLLIGDIDGSSNATLVSEVELILDDYRAAGIYVDVIGATIQNQTIVLRVAGYESGFDADAVDEEIKSSLVLEVNKLQINDTLYKNNLIKVAASIEGAIIDEDALTNDGLSPAQLPLTDITPTFGNVVRTNDSLITISRAP